MDLKVLKYEIQESVAIITLNNPPVNALDVPCFDDLKKIIYNLQNNKTARAAMIASECPGFFSAGDDLNSLKEIDEELVKRQPEVHKLFNDFESLPIPTLSTINGHCLGGGLELALLCDFRFMTKGSGRIGLPEVRLGMIPAFGGTQRLWPIVGKAKAIEMMYKGLQLLPEEALAVGLVNRVVEEEKLFEESFDYCVRLARQATGAIAKIKQCLNVGIQKGFEVGMKMEQKTFLDNIFSEDAKEGVNAFLEGRKPVFKGSSSNKEQST
ncbi:enoyl-CoA hydratase/isomerase family protein [bacterium]|nr:enoyl-CoA hydratase/isomerase family protein [bacterium]